MTDIARLVLDADTRGLKNAERDLKGVDTQARRTANEVDRASGGMAASFKRIGVALAAAGIGTVLYEFGKQSVQAAIDAEEMGSAFNVVFGNMADDVRAWAETTGNALGRSTQEIMRGALAFQELFGKSLDPAQAAEMSKQFAVLTQDLASFKNLSNEVAQQKLFSGLVGEAEPLRAVGVFLSEAALQAKAAELGMRGVNGALTDQEKIVVRAAIIQDQLALAQGDVIRTSDSAANQIKTMNAAVEELQVAIGQKLLPQLTPLITLTAEIITMMAGAAAQLDMTTRSTANFVEGLRVMGGWLQSGADAFRSFGNWLGWADEQMQRAADRALAVAGPIAQVVTFIERLGSASGTQKKFDRLGLGSGAPDFGMLNIQSELAALTGAAKAANDNFALPSVTANLAKMSGGARAAVAPLKMVREEIQETIDLAKEFRNLQVQNPQGGILGDTRLFGFDATMGAGDFGAIGGFAKPFQEFDATLGDTAENAQRQTQTIAESFAQMSRQITGSLQGLANSIRSGDILGILGGVLDIFTSLGSAGVFGSGLQTRLNAPPSFDGGGYTGGGSRSGGMDGKGGFLAMLHPNESVIDHTRGQRAPANDVNITVGIDPRSGNVLAFVDGRIAATGPVIANAGAQQAQAQMARSERRRVR